MASHPSQPTIATYMFWIESLEKIYTKEWKVNHLNSVCDGYNLENWSCENLILASHPSQPLFTTYIISKIEYLDELFCETRQVTQVNHCLRRTYFRKLNIQRNNFARIGKSPKSTNNYNIHIFEIQITLELVGETRQVNQVNRHLRHIYFQKLNLLKSYFARNGESPKSTSNYDVYVLDRASRKNSCQRIASHPFKQYLRHIQFGNWSLPESNSSKSPKSTTV